MKLDTVKVYKGKSVVTINKSDLEVWNESGFFSSSQQKAAAEQAAAEKAAAEQADPK